MRQPVPPTLKLPAPRRRLGGLGISLALHALLLAALFSEPGREWVRSLAPGAINEQRGGGGGGGAGGRAHVVAYISLPPASTPALAPVRAPAPRPRPVVPPKVITPTAPVTPPVPSAPLPPSPPR